MKRPSRKELRILIQQDPEKFIDLFLSLFDRIEELEARLNLNSRNSSKPPSTDGFNKPKPKSLRKKSKRRSGGQKGHKGHHLEMSENPDKTEVIPNKECEHCGRMFRTKDHLRFEKRQVIELVIKTEVIEYQAEVCLCGCGMTSRADFPENVTNKVQYGDKMLSFLVYLNQYQMIPYKRTVELIKDTTGVYISEGTLNNSIKRCYKELLLFEEQAKALLIKASVAGFDETGIRCQKNNYWILVACTLKITLLFFSAKKDKASMEEFGILPYFTGIAVHDCYKTYFNFLCLHALCCAHLLRELVYLFEEDEKKWAGELIELFLIMHKKVIKAKENRQKKLHTKTVNLLTSKYENLTENALKETPILKKRTNSRGRIKQTKERNLLERLQNYKTEILRFINDFNVPFDNNESERAFRMAKVKQKISGCFRNPENGKMFCRIRSYISTVKKNDLSVLEAIANSLRGDPFIPVDT